MKKIFKGLICAGLCGVLALSATGCSPSEHRDPEKTPLRLAIGACDQKFNPMFYTSQNDGEIVGLTQASLVTSDSSGVLAYGDNYPTVTLDYLETYYSEAGSQIGTSNGKGEIDGSSDVNGSTSYEFLIKNDMKFSDGEPVTVMDVLFNLYVYLDPLYSGSSTIYSTKIKGMRTYQEQVPTDDDGGTTSLMKYYPQALERLTTLIDWATDGGANPDENLLSAEGKADLAEVKKEYEDELNSDWNSIATSWEEGYKEYRFTDAWQVFYYIEGIVKNQTEKDEESQSDVELKDGNGKYLTTLDPDKGVEGADVVHQELIDEMEAELTEAKINEFLADNGDMTAAEAKLELSKRYAIKYVYNANSQNSQIDWVLTYCNTANTMLDYLMADEASKDRVEGELDYPRIEGITVSHTADEKHGGKFNGKTYAADHDILRIEINGIDPKAKWNFGFAISPMHYYSDKAHNDAAMNDYKTGKVYAGTATNFGVEYKNAIWMNSTLASNAKSGLPVGAGPYKCCTHNYDQSNLDGDSFFYNNMAYFERNEYFETMGANINNAKIKYVTYKVYPDSQIVSALKTKEIDYATPTATADNQSELNTGNLKQIRYLTGGYGYVGINPAYVPDIEVRQAIMHAFDTSSMIDYYGASLVNLINRPMSTTSWAYPKDSKRYYERWTDEEQIKALVESSGNWTYMEKEGKFRSNADNSVLKLTFTIAGESTDHPAYNMFVAAEAFLERCGFEISVVNDNQALKALAQGKLAVWAAAWSSSIDPDPYQIYSINSNASSTKNWNKTAIVQDGGTGDFATEYEIATRLNNLIVKGRETLNQTDRATIYHQCLDCIMEMAVEFPTYQRYDLCVYNSAVLDVKTMTAKPSFNMGPISELWKVNYKK